MSDKRKRKAKEEKEPIKADEDEEVVKKGKKRSKTEKEDVAKPAKVVKFLPENYHSVTPYMCINNAAKGIEFYKKAFGATELDRYEMGGKIMHAEIKIGDSIIMITDEFPGSPEAHCKSPTTVGTTTVGIAIYVEDVDTVFNKAIAEGAKLKRALKDEFYGDRTGTLEDPFGHVWTIATHIEDVSKEEMLKRMPTTTK